MAGPARHAARCTGKHVLDLGCGYGWFCRWAAQAGAARVLGVDVSAKMLAQAGGMGEHPAIGYARMDLEQLTVAPAAYDLVYSSLAFTTSNGSLPCWPPSAVH
jgi:2-polyprenyl-3-methyl-5-hydroxy-6-metoxy-1,4-benzoquinol methylase